MPEAPFDMPKGQQMEPAAEHIYNPFLHVQICPRILDGDVSTHAEQMRGTEFTFHGDVNTDHSPFSIGMLASQRYDRSCFGLFCCPEARWCYHTLRCLREVVII